MPAFTSSRDAKEFLARSIAAQAQRENVPLSEVERKMLYFSETGWTLPDMNEVSESFDQDHDQEKYEQKIAELSSHFCAEARKNNPAELESWNVAVQTLSAEDH